MLKSLILKVTEYDEKYNVINEWKGDLYHLTDRYFNPSLSLSREDISDLFMLGFKKGFSNYSVTLEKVTFTRQEAYGNRSFTVQENVTGSAIEVIEEYTSIGD